MAGFTPEGFVNKTVEEIIQSNNERLKSKVGQDVPVTPDSVWGVLNGILSLAIKQGGWDLAQQVADQQNVDKAEGKYLDDLAALVFVERILAKGSTGDLLFYTTSGTEIPNNYPIKDNQGRLVLTEYSLQTTKSSCYSCKIKVETLADNTQYIVNINGVSFEYQSGSSATVNDVLDGLITAIGSTLEYSVVKVDETILITNTTNSNLLKVTSSDNLDSNEIGSLVEAEAVIKGAFAYPDNTITIITNPLVGILSVTNPKAFALGSEEETDEELRQRIRSRSTIQGKCTYPAVLSALENLEGVTGVLVQSNRTLTTDPDTGIPPKSTKIFIDGSDEQSIAENIFDITDLTSTYIGDITRTVIDTQGNVFAVKFSRTTEKYGWMKVDYTINSEEVFPSNGEDLIKDAIVTFGNNLRRGEDYDSTKFYGTMYSACQGFYITSVEIAVTENSGDIPSYQQVRIPVSKTENLLFTDNQISLILN